MKNTKRLKKLLTAIAFTLALVTAGAQTKAKPVLPQTTQVDTKPVISTAELTALQSLEAELNNLQAQFTKTNDVVVKIIQDMNAAHPGWTFNVNLGQYVKSVPANPPATTPASVVAPTPVPAAVPVSSNPAK